MRQKQGAIFRLILLVMLAGLLSPIQNASSAENVTKTFTIFDSTNVPLSGALVRAYWQDTLTGINTFTNAVTADSNGVASISIPINAPNAFYTIFPPAGNTRDAVKPDTQILTSANESITVRLVASNFVLNIQKSDGSPVGLGAQVAWPASTTAGDLSWSGIVRPGNFGIKLPENLTVDADYNFFVGQFTDEWMSGQFSWQYLFRASGASGSQTYVVYESNTATTQKLPESDGSYILKFSGSNINGSLKNSDGSPLTLLEGTYVNVAIVPDFLGSCYRCGGNDFFNWKTSPNADWKGRVLGPAGKYRVSFSITGSLTIPSFSSYLWKNDLGGFSTTETGTYTTAIPAELEYRLPATPPNFAYKMVLNGTTTGIPVYQSLELKTVTGDYTYLGGFQSLNGIGSAVLANGDYRLTLSPLDQSLSKSVSYISVLDSVVTVKNAANEVLNATNGIYIYSPISKNFNFHLQKSLVDTSALTSGWINYCVWDSVNKVQSNCMGDGVDTFGDGSSALGNGSFLITVYPGPSNPELSSKSYVATVAGGVVTAVEGSTLTGTPARWTLTANSPNVSGALRATNGTDLLALGAGQGVNVDVQKEINGNWQWINMGSWRTTPTFGFNLSDAGHYRILVNPRGLNDWSWSYSSEFWIDANNKMSKISAEDAISNGTQTLTNFDITVKASNLLFKVTDPRDSSLLKYGWISVIKKEVNGNQTWIMNADINSNNPGITGAFLTEGNYRLELNPQQGATLTAGLARKNYDAVVSAGGTISVTDKNIEVPKVDNGRFSLSPAYANITGRITDQNGTPLAGGNNQWVNINVQRFIPTENRWEWTNNWANTDLDGNFNLSVSDVGTYRLRIEPNGYTNAAVTFSVEFIITQENKLTFTQSFGPIKALAPSLRLSVVSENGGITPLQFTGIEIRKNNNWIDWANTMQNGIASISFTEAGEYQLVVQPTQEQLNLGKTRKTYTVVATDTNGVITAVVTAAVGVTVPSAGGVYLLALGTGTLVGTVYGPDQTPIANSAVVPVDLITNQEKWEFAVWTSQTGKWAMALPAGSYSIIAKAPYGTSTLGNSDSIATVNVDSSGRATLADAAATTPGTPFQFDLKLKLPTWHGQLLSPTGTGVAFAQICLYNNDYWNCATTGANGNWALSSQTGVTTYSANSFLVIGDYRNGVYPEMRFEGVDQITAVLGSPTGEADARPISFTESNVAITVTAGGIPVPYVWVSLDRPNIGYLGGNQTNADGIANIRISNLVGPVNVRVDPNNNRGIAANYTTTIKSYDETQASSKVTGEPLKFIDSIALETPNLRGVLREPTVGGIQGSLSPYSWVELFLGSSGQWLGGSSTDSSGVFSLNVPKPVTGSLEYTLFVNPPWNGTGGTSRTKYTVLATPDKISVIVVDPVTDNPTELVPVSAGSNSYYQLTLAQTSVRGTVIDSSNASNTGVRDSWVVPIDAATGEWYWQQGSNSQAGGAFGLALQNGNYKLQARVPWNTSNLANSAQCPITVAGGIVTVVGDACKGTDGTIKLALRPPNLTMKLILNGNPVAFASVGIALGNWYVNAQSNKDGQISLFVDSAAILAANPGLTGSANKFYVWVDPPYGTSDMVRWDCQSGDIKPVCVGLRDFDVSTEYNGGTPISLGTLEVLQPNIKLQVMDPTTTPVNIGANAWVNLFSYDTANPEAQRWLGGSNTDSSGNAAFNIDSLFSNPMGGAESATTRYKLEINPPWNKKDTLSTKIYVGLTLNGINGAKFNVGIPNVTVSVKLPGGTADNKWGWIGIEEVYSSGLNVNLTKSWVGGFGLNDKGIAAVTLSPSSRYKITANPAGGRAGTMTTCYIQTDAAILISRVEALCLASTKDIIGNQLEIKLFAGNVTGIVKSSAGVVKNATVYANVLGATDEVNAVISTTLVDGSFGLNLDPNKVWEIRILPFNKPGDVQLAVTILVAPVFTAEGTFNYNEITLV